MRIIKRTDQNVSTNTDDKAGNIKQINSVNVLVLGSSSSIVAENSRINSGVASNEQRSRSYRPCYSCDTTIYQWNRCRFRFPLRFFANSELASATQTANEHVCRDMGVYKREWSFTSPLF